jgi:predicted Mrr-cat superfamily restriction endonuclease
MGPRLWLVRTGEGGYKLGDCIRAGVVALRYTRVGDATSLSVEEIADGVDKVNTIGVARMLHRFVHDVAVGDLVATPHAKEREVFFGEVVGGYRFADPSPVDGFRHLRDMGWWGSVSRDDEVHPDRLVDIDRQPTLYELPNPEYWLERAEACRTLRQTVIERF